MNITNKLKIGALSAGLVALASCGESEDLELAKTEYNGEARIRLVQETVDFGRDNYRIEIQDSTGVVIAYMKSHGYPWESKIKTDDGVYDIRIKGIRPKGIRPKTPVHILE